MTLLNLTPHPIRVYSESTSDRIADLSSGLLFRLDPAERPCRIATVDHGPNAEAVDYYGNGYVVTVREVQFGNVDNLPDPEPGLLLVVPLLVARDQAHRSDLVYPLDEVRNSEGTVVGCRAFGRVAAADKDGVDLKLGWSNPDTGPTQLRLYALDAGDSPRWAKPHARVAEVPLIERGAREGDRFRLIAVSQRPS